MLQSLFLLFKKSTLGFYRLLKGRSLQKQEEQRVHTLSTR